MHVYTDKYHTADPVRIQGPKTHTNTNCQQRLNERKTAVSLSDILLYMMYITEFVCAFESIPMCMA